MNYRLYCDGLTLYNSRVEDMRILSPTLEVELNKTGSLQFTLPHDHPYYGLVKKLKSVLTLYQDDYLLFRGRVLDESAGWHNEKVISCEGDTAFLLDSVQRPFSISGTAAEFLAYVLQLHNAQVEENKWFLPGNVTVEGYVVHDAEECASTKETLEKALVEPFGGYLISRYENGAAYLDYLADITLLAQQKVEFGKNLLDLKTIRKGADIATVIVPMGAKLKDEEGKDTGKRLTIESVNGGADFVLDADGIAQFGTIVKYVKFDDVTDAEELKQLGQAHLAKAVKLPDTIELTAADLAAAGADVAAFHLGTKVRVTSGPHGIDQLFTVTKLSINLFNPAATKLTLGGTVVGFSGAVQGLGQAQSNIVQAMEKAERTASEAVYNVEQNLLASMQTTAENITLAVSESYTLKEDAEALVSAVSTEVEVVKDSFNITFSQFNADLEAVAAGTDAEFEEIRKYIRFTDGKILLGEVGNELELQIANDRISFLQDGAEVAYFSNRKLYVTDTQILHSLQLGSFAFMPRDNGNLSFKKI